MYTCGNKRRSAKDKIKQNNESAYSPEKRPRLGWFN